MHLASPRDIFRRIVPRQPRLDAPDTRHHVMVRGIERTAIFRDDVERTAFLARLAALAEAGALTVYAWALLPNHAHLLVRTGTRPLPRSMRSLLTGYAGAFNRRHKRVGHLFQNRYKSIVVAAEPYLLELVRYLHLNPLRANAVPSLRALARSPWTGHSALLGTVPRPWQDTRTSLAQFGPTLSRGRKGYRAFVARYQRAVEPATGCPHGRIPLERLVAQVCRQVGLTPATLQGGGRTARPTAARAGIAYRWTEVLGHPGRPLAGVLGVFPAAVYKAARRGAAQAPAWQRLLGRTGKET